MAKTKTLQEGLKRKAKQHQKRRASQQEENYPVTKLVEIAKVRTDGDTQPRVSMDPEVVEEYAARMKQDRFTQEVLDPEGQSFPPAIVYIDDDESMWLADGFHRLSAAERAGFTTFQATIHRGTQTDALVASLGANATHGKRRTNADKRRAVARALERDELGQRSDAHVASLCKVSDRFVSKLREELILAGSVPYRETLLGADGVAREVMPPEGYLEAHTGGDEVSVSDEGVAPARAARVAKATKKTQDKATFTTIEAIAGSDTHKDVCLVTYPLTLDDYETIAEHAAGVIQRGRLVVAISQGSILSLSGPARLGALLQTGFKGPHYVHLREHDRTYLVFSKGSSLKAHSGVCALEALTEELELKVFGKPLDVWS